MYIKGNGIIMQNVKHLLLSLSLSIYIYIYRTESKNQKMAVPSFLFLFCFLVYVHSNLVSFFWGGMSILAMFVLFLLDVFCFVFPPPTKDSLFVPSWS